jgi:molybdopterin-synthase adenylyltransferase
LFGLLRERNMISSASRESWLNDPEFLRFDRQLRLLSEILPTSATPLDVQKKIDVSRVIIVGLGGTGSHMLQGLAELGVGRYLLVDPDTVEPSNFNRQPIYTAESVGRSKVSVGQEWLRAFLPTAEVRSVCGHLGDRTVTDAIGGFQPTLIVNCADQPSIESTTAKCIGLSSPDNAIPVLVAGGYFLLNSFAGPFIVPGKSACLSCESLGPELHEHIPAIGGNAGFVASLGASIALVSALAAMTGAIDNPLENCQVALELPEIRISKRQLTLNSTCLVCGQYQKTVS